MIPPIQSTSCGATQPEMKIYPSDEEFILHFLEMPYVYETARDWYGTNCCLHSRSEQIHFVENSDNNFTIYLNNKLIGTIERTSVWVLTWLQGNGSTQFKTLAEAVENSLSQYPPFSGTHYYRGIIDAKLMGQSWGNHVLQNFSEDEILRDEPIGTYFILGLHANSWERLNDTYNYRYLIYIKSSADKIEWIRPDLDMARVNKYITIDFSESEERDILSKRPELQQIRLCQSLLDISILKRMSEEEITRTIKSWTPDFFKGVKHLSFVHEKYDGKKGIFILTELLIHIAKIGCTSIKIHFEKTDKLPVYVKTSEVDSDSICRDVLNRMRQELQDEALNWAIDNFLEVIFFKTIDRTDSNFLQPSENNNWKDFCNNPDKDPNIQIQLRDGLTMIYAHKANLARYSPMLDTMFYGRVKKTDDKPIKFDGFSDIVIDEFVKMCYDRKTDFSKCDFIDLVRFADYLQSPLLMDIANKLFDNKNDLQTLEQLIRLGLWRSFRNNSHFFKLVGVNWVNIVETLPNEGRVAFREHFLNDWSEYLRKLNRNLIKV